MSYSIHKDETQVEKALKCCRGCYQRAIIFGYEAMSGGTLKGRAKKYSGRYARSVRNLKKRMTNFGVAWEEQIGEKNKRVLVLG